MDLDDVVETSDVEEREVLHVPERGLKDFSAPDSDAHEPRHAASTLKSREPGLILSAISSNFWEDDQDSPRKRVKVFHHTTSPQEPELGPFEDISHLSSSFLASSFLPSQSSSAIESVPEMILTPTPDGSPPMANLDASTSPSSQRGTDSGVHHLSLGDLSSSQSILRFPNEDLGEIESTSPNPRDRSCSADPWSLFSSPIRSRPVTPSSSMKRASDEIEGLADPQQVSRESPRQRQTSPLTPPPSSNQIALAMVRSPSHDSAGAPQAAAPPHSAVVTIDPQSVLHDDGFQYNRYALRTRQARQLNPYAYDKLQYKQQMRSNPDAIVKFRSPRRRSEPGAFERGEEGTQDASVEDYVFPTGDIEDDEDYVGSTGRRRRRSASAVQDEGEGTSGPLSAPGWLPEFLRDLSDSDIEDDEVRKDVKASRKAREAAETKKSRKRRVRPFPLAMASTSHQLLPEGLPPGSAFHQSSPLGPSDMNSPPLPPLYSGHHRRGTSHPTRSSPSPIIFPASPYYSDDPLVLDDGNSVIEIPSRSPSPRGTSTDADSYVDNPIGQSAAMSDGELTDAPSDHATSRHDPSPIMNAKDRRRLRILGRMVPAVMLNHLEKNKTNQQVSRRYSTPPGSDASDVPGPLLPGQTRIRKGTSYRDVEVKGDSESSDIERPPSPSSSSEMRRPQLIEIARSHDQDVPHRSRYPEARDTDSDDSESAISISSDDNVDGATISEWVADRPSRGRGHAHEKSLVDYMLMRTRIVGETRRAGAGRAKTSGRSRTVRKPGLNVVTNGARKHGESHQSLLPFVKSSGGRDPQPRNRERAEHVVEEVKAGRRKKKRTRAAVQGQVYNFQAEGTRITSRHKEKHYHVVEEELEIDNVDEGFHRALDPLWREETGRPKHTPPRPLLQARPPAVPVAWTAPSKPISSSREGPVWSSNSPRRRVKVDLDISVIPSGITFAAYTYIGRGLLHQLVSLASGQSEPIAPVSYSAQGFDLNPAIPPSTFSNTFRDICERLGDSLDKHEDISADCAKDWDNIMHACCLLISWLPTGAEEEDFRNFQVAIQDNARSLISRAEGAPLSVLSLAIYWFSIDLSVRLMRVTKNWPGSNDLIKHIMLLMRRLYATGLDKTLAAVMVNNAEVTIGASTVPQKSAELWVCLFHLVGGCEMQFQGEAGISETGHPFWRLVQRLLQDEVNSSRSSLEASEKTWRTIFSFCALSQFSVHGMSTSVCRLPAFWEAVGFALKQIRLTADTQTDHLLSDHALDKRDDYIRLIASRCCLLWSRWQWHLDDALPMFSQLVEIFKSRKFANLRDEPSDFLSFMTERNLQLLSCHKSTDTAFELFLKLVVQAAQTGHIGETHAIVHQKLSQVKKILHLAVPVGSVPFTKAMPPTKHDLSMLYNRLSAMAVAMHIDPTLPNLRHRLVQARRCVNFKEADINSRNACIRASMYFAIILRHHHIPLVDVLEWIEDMTNILFDEYQVSCAPIDRDGKASGRVSAEPTVVFNILMLLGSVRMIIETRSLDQTQNLAEYPDPALLEGPWVTKIFAPSNNLAFGRAGAELRLLVQSFLDARSLVLPKPNFHVPIPEAESQESQDEYGQFSLDFNDPELLAALGDADPIAAPDYKPQETAICKTIDKHISPALYRLVCKQFRDGEHSRAITLEDYCCNTDQWIDCWVGCANVLVQNRLREWSLYMKLGPQSWERIIDATWRRRVGLRFNFTLLQLDPGAYLAHKDHFIAVLLESAVSATTTLEHQYTSLVFSVDGLQHPLLRGVPCELPIGSTRFDISKARYTEIRLLLLQTVFSNLSDSLRMNKYQQETIAANQTHVGFLVSVLSTMRDVYESGANGAGHATYHDFCSQVIRLLLCHQELSSQPRLSHAIDWGRSVVLGGEGNKALGDAGHPP
ncbi:hypothetical protein BV22DRAFT_245793 [Leucogyrophana mollusca]|uniref:Uncharacterized protein n=1 Tax=Leucogyrophana mollusca TaxID=85980 RepID=A0ACB8BQS8_9AGAM|nr:hypothetical protein BV22DRAFT_245793 [Leucogyrophana mollusca]